MLYLKGLNMRKIGKISTLLLTALFAAVILVPMVNQAHAYVQQWTWLPGYVYRGYDPYYDPSNNYPVIAYLNGTTANLKVPVYYDVSWMGPSANITAVSLVFDTGYNITLSTVVNATLYTTKYFDFSFTADTNTLSNLWAHTYTIYVDLQDNLGAKHDDYWQPTWNNYYPYYKFVVYTQDQKDVMDSSREYNALVNGYYPNTVEARLLKQQAYSEATVAENSMQKGNFTESKAHYQQAISLIQQSIDSEGTRGGAIEDAQLNATLTDASASMKQADAAMLQAQAVMNQGYGYVLLGLGGILIGIGVIAYGMRKPKQ